MTFSLRPIIKIEPNRFDKNLNYFSWLTFFFLWAYSFFEYSRLPEIIPIHFDISMKPDDYGSKSTILILPAIISIVFAPLHLIKKIPHYFNYVTISVTQENAEKLYRIAIKMISVLCFSILLIGIFLQYITIDSVLKGSFEMPYLIPVIILFMIFAPVIYFIIKMYRIK